MDGTPRNGMNVPEDFDDEDDTVAEDDIFEVIDLGENNPEGEMTGDMDMLDVGSGDEEEQREEAEIITISPERDDSKVVFSKHTGSVFCVDSDGQVAVTGGEDDKAYVWKVATGEILLECSGHKDSVTCVGISPGSAFVATGDLGGLVQVWSLQQLKCVWSFEVSDLEWLEWHHSSPVLLAGTVAGDMWMWRIPGGDSKTFQSYGVGCVQGQVMPDGKRALTGYADGTVRVWDLKSTALLHAFTGQISAQSSITSLACHKDNSLAMSGSTDCSATLLNTSVGKVLGRLQCHGGATGAEDNSVECVGLSNILPFAATGTLAGKLALWDVPTQICRQQCRHESGVVKLCWHETQPLLYTCTLGGAVCLWDSRNGKKEREWLGHEASILDLHVSRDGNTITTTSDDQTARVFSLT